MAEAKKKTSVRSSTYYSLILLRTQLQSLRDSEGFVYPEALIFPCKELTRLIEELEADGHTIP